MKVLLATASIDMGNVVQGRNLSIHLLRLWAETDGELARSVELETFERGRSDASSFTRELIALAPDVLCLSCYLWNTTFLIGCARAVRRGLPGTRVVLGGPDSSPRAARLLRRHPFIDAVAQGEGEEALRLLLRRLAGLDPGGLETTPGFVVRGDDGEPVATEPLPPIDIDDVPSLLEAPEVVREHGALTIEMGRGCRYHCSYCQYNNVPRRVRGIEKTRDELARYAEMGGGEVLPLDSALNQERGRMGAILREGL